MGKIKKKINLQVDNSFGITLCRDCVENMMQRFTRLLSQKDSLVAERERCLELLGVKPLSSEGRVDKVRKKYICNIMLRCS